MPRRKTHDEFVKEVKEKYGDDYTVLGKYKNAKTKLLVKHKCGEEWEVTPHHFLNYHGCPVCGKIKCKINRTKTHEKFIEEVKKKYGKKYLVLGEYINNRTKILVRHNSKKCNYYEYEVKPSNLLRGQGCPVCSGREAKLGINTIWDTDRWMVDLGVSEEDAKRYKSKSGKKITVKCPDCGREKKTTPNKIYARKSIFCSCGDGKSYPEKFVMSLLKQLNVNFEIEYKPNWAGNKRYDFYIPKLKCIIETHGRQHYKENTFKYCGGRTLEEEQSNDGLKKEMALKNGIKYYIELNCSESDMDYVKNNLLNSELAKLFDLSKIDWLKCAKFANKNIVKEVCDYWENRKNDETTSDLGKKFKLTRNTIINYLKRGTKLDWCTYKAKEETKKCGIKSNRYNKKKVEIFKDGQSLGIFESCNLLARESGKLFGIKLCPSHISRTCNNKRKQYKGFTFKYVEEDNNLNISKIA